MNNETKELVKSLLQAVNDARIECILNQKTYGDNLESWLFEIESDLTDFARTNMHIKAVK